MQKIFDRGVPISNNKNYSCSQRLRTWDGARAFLEVVRYGSFRSAAQVLNTSINTLRREIDNFERKIGIILLTRHVDGVRLTPEGTLLVETVKRMETASLDIARIRNMGVAMHGVVRLSITEGLGTFWVAPRLVEFQQAYPGLLVDIHCAMHPADVLRLETDIAIQLTPPTAKDLIVVKLGFLHSMMFASQNYLSKHGSPRTLEELGKHNLVLQVTDQLRTEEIYRKIFPNKPQIGFVTFRTNVSSSHYWIIARGAGIGALPTYATALGGKVVPVDIEGFQFTDTIWLTYHPDVARIPRIRRLIDWLTEAFSPKKYPWFSEKFIHPRDLPKVIDNTDFSELFEGFDGVR